MIGIGTRLGPYQIVARIGAGGMGEVWRATDTRLDRSVAIKILPAEFAQNTRLKIRFEQEARTISQLNHPHICTLYDVGDDYLAMELLEGETLKEKIDRGSIPPRKSTEYAIQMAKGLAAAHDKGVIHRDLKPANIFVTTDGRVKLLDFGLAKVDLRSESGHSEGVTQERVTNPGTVMGTGGYMSPEQVRGQEVDYRTDIFAFGAILYEMLSGRRAFYGPSAADTMTAILKEDPPELQGVDHGISPALDRIVRRCLEKNREERFRSAHDLAFALEAISSTSGSGAVDAMGAPHRIVRPLVVATGVAIAVVAGFFIGRWVTSTTMTPRRQPRLTQLTFEAGVEGQPSISPDGTSFVYTALTSPDNTDIFLRRVGGENAVNLTRELTASDAHPAFSPDGQMIAFRSDLSPSGGIYIMGATGEGLRRLTDFGFNPSWSSDGTYLLVATAGIWDPTTRFQRSQIWRVEVASGEKKLIDVGGDAVQPVCSPHGKTIAFWGLLGSTGKRVLYTVPAAGGTPRALTDDLFMNWNPLWSPDGRYLYFSSNRSGPMNLWRMPIDEESGKPLGAPEAVTTAGQWNGQASISRSGKIAYLSESLSTSIVRFPVDPRTQRLGEPTVVLSGSRQFWQATPSPDSQWVVLAAFDATEDLFVMKSDGSGLRRLTNDQFKDRSAQWTKDSNTIYFLSDRSGRYETWRINRDGSGLQQVTRNADDFSEIVVGADPKKAIAFFRASPINRAFGIYDLTQPLPLRQPKWIPPIDANHALIGDVFLASADGRFVCGQARTVRETLPGVWTYSFESRQYEKITNRGDAAGWFPDNRTILFRDRDELFVVDRLTKATRKIFDIPKGYIAFEMSADGRSMYGPRREEEGDIWMLEQQGQASTK